MQCDVYIYLVEIFRCYVYDIYRYVLDANMFVDYGRHDVCIDC